MFMSATTIKLSPELRQRVARLVRGTGKSMHAFMLEAIEQQTSLAERRKSFVADALAARADANASRRGYLLEDVREHYSARAAGRPARKLRAKKWRG
jgi:predicted transcriptional regulator